MRMARLAGAAAVAIAALAVSAASASATPEVVYSNLPASNPGNVVSLGYEATSTAQFGGEIEVVGKLLSSAGSVTVGMSSWGCEQGTWQGTPECITTPGAKFSLPITMSINEVGPGNSVGKLLVSVTKTFKLPYRPSQNNKQCKGASAGAWYDGTLHSCFHGKYAAITFPVQGKFLWPARAIVSVAYNTSDYGAVPQRPQACNSTAAGCPYDSLNVGLAELAETPTPSTGSYPNPASEYLSSTWSGAYCDGGAGGTGTFRLDEPCTEEYQPLISVKATP
jgi:hypothetical protein